MANFPSSIYGPRVLVNRQGRTFDVDKTEILFAEDLNWANEEITAIETELLAAASREYDDNAAALSAGLIVGQLYRTGDILKIVHD